jgi:hypothetical protein
MTWLGGWGSSNDWSEEFGLPDLQDQVVVGEWTYISVHVDDMTIEGWIPADYDTNGLNFELAEEGQVWFDHWTFTDTPEEGMLDGAPGEACDCDFLAIALDHTYDWEGIDALLPDAIEGEVTIEGTVEVGGSVLVSAPCADFHDMAQLVHSDCTPTEEQWRTWDFDTCEDIEIPGDLLNPGGETTLAEDHFGLWAFWSNGDLYLFELCPEAAPPPEPAPPVDIEGPHKANEGDDVTLTTVLTDIDPSSYQWYKDGEALEGETGTELALIGVTVDDSGEYSVVVDDGEGGGDAAYALFESRGHTVMVFPVGGAPLAGGLGLGLLVGACALAGVVSIRRKK